MKNTALLLFLSLINCSLFAQYPGNVDTGLLFWVKANDGTSCSTPGCSINQWNDFSGNTDHLSQTTSFRQPQFTENVSNFNPGIVLDGSDDRMRRDVVNYTSDFTIFIAARVDISATSPEGTIFNNHFDNGSGNGDLSSFQIDTDGTTYRYRNLEEILYGPYVNEYVILAATNTDFGLPNTNVTTYRNEVLVGSLDFSGTNRAQTFNDYVIGVNRINSNYMAGEISEIVLYDRVLTLAEINRVESYLAIKYGLTLGVNGTSLDYNSSTSTVIWDQSGNTDFNFAIGGIGRDDNSQLNQKQSQSIYDAIVTIGNGDNLFSTNALNTNNFTADNAFLLWGNDNGLLTFNCNTNVPIGYGQLFERTWKVQETGSVGDVVVAFDMTSAGLTGTASDYALIIDTDNDGNYDDETPFTGTIIGNNLTFTGVDFISGNTFTLIQVDDYRLETVDVSICEGTTYTLPNGQMVSLSDTYIDTLIIPGCDSIITTNLTLLSSDTIIIDTSICNGTTYSIAGSDYTASGIYFDLVGTNVLGCDSIVQTNLVVNPLPNVIPNSNSNPLCEGDSLLLYGSGSQATYTWDNEVIDSVAFIPNIGTTIYIVTGTDSNNCQAIDSISITTYTLPEVNGIVNDNIICEGQEVVFSSSGTAVAYEWDNGVIEGIPFTPLPEQSLFTVTGTDSNGCENSDVLELLIEECNDDCEVTFPNVFSPNDDGINDKFSVITDCLFFESYQLTIYNRWGGLVFESNQPENSWDGYFNTKKAPLDVYVFVLTYKLPGEPSEILKGDVTLLR